VVPTLGTLPGQHRGSGRLLPGATSALLDLAQDDAEAHLHEQVARLQARGLAVTGGVQRGDPAATIVRTAKRVGADLVVLGTHGRTGLEAFWSESVAPQVIVRSHVPLLLVPVRESVA
jgi:nucleotide-binding universal stress UspA family protein